MEYDKATLQALAEKISPEDVEKALHRKLCRERLPLFVQTIWPVVRPGIPLLWNWHIDVICQHLERVSHPEIHKTEKARRLLINVPPGAMKSLLVGVIWPAWVWLTKPSFQFLFATYQSQLTLRDATMSHQLMESQEYKELIIKRFGPKKDGPWQFDSSQDTKGYFRNTEGGHRVSLSVDGAGTGYRGDAIVFDDPTNVPKTGSPSAEQLQSTIDWWENRMATRANDPAHSSFVGIMQRLHEMDLSGYLLAQDEEQRKAENDDWSYYEHICIPAVYKAEKPKPYDPRRVDGELFFPSRFPQKVLNEYHVKLADFGFSAQFQQDPFPAGGGLFQVSKLKLWKPAGWLDELKEYQVKDREGNTIILEVIEKPEAFQQFNTCQSWDLAFKDLDHSDFVCGQVWCQALGKFWMLDMVMDRMDVTKTMQAIRTMSATWPSAYAKYVEDKANGPAVIAMLDNEILGLEAVNPLGGKESRASAVVPFVDAGDVVLPHPAIQPLSGELISQLMRFPKGKHDDAVDAMTQALNAMGLRSTSYLDDIVNGFAALERQMRGR